MSNAHVHLMQAASVRATPLASWHRTCAAFISVNWTINPGDGAVHAGLHQHLLQSTDMLVICAQIVLAEHMCAHRYTCIRCPGCMDP